MPDEEFGGVELAIEQNQVSGHQFSLRLPSAYEIVSEQQQHQLVCRRDFDHTHDALAQRAYSRKQSDRKRFKLEEHP